MQAGTLVDLGSPVSGSRYGYYIREYDRNECTHVCEVDLLSSKTPNKTVGIVRLINWGGVSVASSQHALCPSRSAPPPMLIDSSAKNDPYTTNVECVCGCGKRTARGAFLPGHNAKARSLLRKGVPPQILIDFVNRTPKWKALYGHLI